MTSTLSVNDKELDAFKQLASATDEFEQYRSPHASRIAQLADEIAQRFLLASRDRKSLGAAALLHDLGEVAMERDYIQRAGELTAEERFDLSRHPVIGEQEAARAGADRATNLLVRWHHEWWNGCGYPDGLRGEEIPLACRILRLADSFVALTANRPFREAYAQEVARQMIRERAAIEFDPRVVQTFLQLELAEQVQPATEAAIPINERNEDKELFSSFMK
jgi:HD-GYP domain-containing protein (c-di-GMP phosphodiesterase class II)